MELKIYDLDCAYCEAVDYQLRAIEAMADKLATYSKLQQSRYLFVALLHYMLECRTSALLCSRHRVKATLLLCTCVVMTMHLSYLLREARSAG